jgi:hypothetical protein
MTTSTIESSNEPSNESNIEEFVKEETINKNLLETLDSDDDEDIENMSPEEFEKRREIALSTLFNMIQIQTVLALGKIKEMEEKSIDGKIDLLKAQMLDETITVVILIEKLDRDILFNSKELIETRAFLRDIELYPVPGPNDFVSDEVRKECQDHWNKLHENDTEEEKLYYANIGYNFNDDENTLENLMRKEIDFHFGDDGDDEVPDLVSDEVPDLVSDEVPDLVSDEVPDLVPDEVPDLVSDEVPDLVSDEVPDLVPDEVPNLVSDEVPNLVSDEGEMNGIVKNINWITNEEDFLVPVFIKYAHKGYNEEIHLEDDEEVPDLVKNSEESIVEAKSFTKTLDCDNEGENFNESLNIEKIKKCSGGDKIYARDFKMSNSLPKFSLDDDLDFSRIKTLPFQSTFTNEIKDDI